MPPLSYCPTGVYLIALDRPFGQPRITRIVTRRSMGPFPAADVATCQPRLAPSLTGTPTCAAFLESLVRLPTLTPDAPLGGSGSRQTSPTDRHTPNFRWLATNSRLRRVPFPPTTGAPIPCRQWSRKKPRISPPTRS